jgi:predicted transcriptional regulator
LSRELKVHVGEGFDAVAKRVADAWRRAERGETVREDHLTFVSWSALSSTMTGKRLELLRHLHRKPEASVAALARSLGRDYKRVHEDIEALAAVGLVERGADGLKAEYDEIRAVVSL